LEGAIWPFLIIILGWVHFWIDSQCCYSRLWALGWGCWSDSSPAVCGGQILHMETLWAQKRHVCSGGEHTCPDTEGVWKNT